MRNNTVPSIPDQNQQQLTQQNNFIAEVQSALEMSKKVIGELVLQLNNMQTTLQQTKQQFNTEKQTLQKTIKDLGDQILKLSPPKVTPPEALPETKKG